MGDHLEPQAVAERSSHCGRAVTAAIFDDYEPARCRQLIDHGADRVDAPRGARFLVVHRDDHHEWRSVHLRY